MDPVNRAGVVGIGGVFLRAKNPDVLEAWYAEVLSVVSDPFWTQDAGPTVIAMFDQDSDYFGNLDQAFMLNFRTADLDALMARLTALGIDIITKPEWNSDIGTFARIHDPEGNPIELWQPGPAAGGPL